MAIAFDASDPASITGTAATALTTASFTPPANALLVALVCVGNSTGSGQKTGTITDSLSQSWTRQLRQNPTGQGCAEVWYFQCGASPSAQTVTMTPTATSGKGTVLTVLVLTGAASGSAAVGASVTSGGAAYEAAIVTTVTGSFVVGAVVNVTAGASITADATSTSLHAVNDSTNGETYGTFRTTNATGTPGSTTVGFGTATANTIERAFLEILAAAGGAVTLSGVISVAGAGTASPLLAAALYGSGAISTGAAARLDRAAAFTGSGAVAAGSGAGLLRAAVLSGSGAASSGSGAALSNAVYLSGSGAASSTGGANLSKSTPSTVGFFETFNKADSTILGPDNSWTEVNGDLEVQNNQARPITTAPTFFSSARCDTDLGTADMSISAIVPVLTFDTGGVSAVGIAARFSDGADTYYTLNVYKFVTAANGHWQLETVSAGNETVLAEADYTYAANDDLRLVTVGTTIVGYINGVQVASVTDSSITTGTKAGIVGYRLLPNDDARIDNVGGRPTSIALTGKGSAASGGGATLTVVGGGSAIPLTGAGSAAAGSQATLLLAAALTGHGDAAATGTASPLLAAALTGAGSAAASGQASPSLAIALSGSGAASAAGTATLLVSTVVAGSGHAAAAGTGTLLLAADLSGHGDAATSGTATLARAVALSGSGAVSSSGTGTLGLTAALSGQGPASAAGTASLLSALALTGHGDAASASTASLTVTNLNAVSLTGSGSAASAGTAQLVVALTLAGAGTASATGQVIIAVTLALLTHGDAAATGRATLTVTGITPPTGRHPIAFGRRRAVSPRSHGIRVNPGL